MFNNYEIRSSGKTGLFSLQLFIQKTSFHEFRVGGRGWKVDYFTCICLSIAEYWTTRLENSGPTTLITKHKLKLKRMNGNIRKRMGI